MDNQVQTTPRWLPALVKQIDESLHQLTAHRHDQRPALQQELQQIEENMLGWSSSLGKPKLPSVVRESIESQWAAAAERQREIQAELSDLSRASAQAKELVRPDQVLERLQQLAHVLAVNDPTRGNLELSLHIDRIICYRDERVTMRMCKLGIMPDAAGMLSVLGSPSQVNDFATVSPSRARRRSKLRIIDEAGKVDLRAQAEFAASSARFVGLGDEWFWHDEFRIPKSTSWAAKNAEGVFRRRQESRLSYAKLAIEFGVTPPSIGAAIRQYLVKHPDAHDEVVLQRGGKRRPKFNLTEIADEVRRLWLDGWSKLALAKKYGFSSPTVDKAIKLAYTREGKAVPNPEEIRCAKATQARRLLGEGMALDSVAAKMMLSVSTVRKLLRLSFHAEGKQMPDLRRKSSSWADGLSIDESVDCS